VHGIALDPAQRTRLDRAGAGLIWCPSSNLSLFGKTAEVVDLMEHRRVALGTDSRLSGARDLLDELHLVGQISALDDASLESLVTSHSAQLLRLPDRGALRVGSRADILILPARTRLAAASRADVRLVLIEGIVRFGDKDYAQSVAPASQWAEIRGRWQPEDPRHPYCRAPVPGENQRGRTRASELDREGGMTTAATSDPGR